MSTQILYNSINPFAGLGPTPMMGREDQPVRLNDRWATLTTITLAGVITGVCDGGYPGMVSTQQQLIQNFSQDFKDLQIIDNSIEVYKAPYCTVKSINFDPNRYTRLVPYQITIDCYDDAIFSGQYGVIDPTANVEYKNEVNGNVTIVRNLSAKGFVTTSTNRTNDAITNAISWVQGRTGWANTLLPTTVPEFIPYNGNKVPCLTRFEEVTDRFKGIYSVTEEYKVFPNSVNSSILNYGVDIQYSDEDGVFKVVVAGNVEGCQQTPMSTIRTQFNGINLYNIANSTLLKNYPNSINLNPDWVEREITESTDLKRLDFSITFDTDTLPTVIFDYIITSEQNILEDQNSVSINGTIKGRGSLKTRWDKVQAHYAGLGIDNMAQSFYNQKGYPYGLVTIPIQYNVELNPFAGEITITAVYNDRELPPAGYNDYSYTIEVIPRLYQKNPIAALDGGYIIQDLSSPKRAQVSIKGEANSNSLNPNALKDKMSSEIAKHVRESSRKKVLKDQSVDYNILGQSYAYTFQEIQTYEEDKDFTA